LRHDVDLEALLFLIDAAFKGYWDPRQLVAFYQADPRDLDRRYLRLTLRVLLRTQVVLGNSCDPAVRPARAGATAGRLAALVSPHQGILVRRPIRFVSVVSPPGPSPPRVKKS
jgi:hypothetical protein